MSDKKNSLTMKNGNKSEKLSFFVVCDERMKDRNEKQQKTRRWKKYSLCYDFYCRVMNHKGNEGKPRNCGKKKTP